MQITITSTDKTANNDPANPGWRVWTGLTEGGTPVYVFVSKVTVATGLADAAYQEFTPALVEGVQTDIQSTLYARDFV